MLMLLFWYIPSAMIFFCLFCRSDSLPLEEIKDVYLLDFVGPPGFVEDIAPKVERITILDHHKTAFESLCVNATLGQNVTKVIDMQRSGATIAFDFFRNKLLTEVSTSRGNESGKDVAKVKYVPDNKAETVHKLFIVCTGRKGHRQRSIAVAACRAERSDHKAASEALRHRAALRGARNDALPAHAGRSGGALTVNALAPTASAPPTNY